MSSPTDPTDFDHPLVRGFDAAGEHLAARYRGHPTVDRAMYALSQAGNHSLIWHSINAVDALVGGEAGRKRALRRSLILGCEQAVVNGPLKSVFRRGRPGHVTDHPHDLRKPRTSSFPSGHASAGACAATLLSADLGWAPVWFTLAGAVAWSRVHVGAHHPSDVAAGFVAGRSFSRLAGALWPRPRPGVLVVDTTPK